MFATFESQTDYFGSRAQQAMLNFRVGDLDAMIAQLRANGADVAEEIQEMEGVGRFGWVTDPEGKPDRALAARLTARRAGADAALDRTCTRPPQSSSALTVPAPTVRPPSRIAKVWPASSATGLPSSTVTCTVCPGTASAPASAPSRLSTPDTSVVRT